MLKKNETRKACLVPGSKVALHMAVRYPETEKLLKSLASTRTSERGWTTLASSSRIHAPLETFHSRTAVPSPQFNKNTTKHAQRCFSESSEQQKRNERQQTNERNRHAICP